MRAPDRVAFHILGIDILWYGVLVVTGIVLTMVVIFKRSRAHRLNPDRMLNYALITIPVGALGARIYYVAFEWDYYKANPSEIFDFRGGGLAVHGGLLFGIAALLILSRIWKDRPLDLLDLVAGAVPLGQAIGRWGNFFNEEAYGPPTDLPWAQIINGVGVHPTFLYESLWCFALFIFLQFMDRRQKFLGQIFLLYVMLYSLERFFIEGMRTDSLMLTANLKQAQVLSAVAFLAALIAYIRWRKKGKK
jgi:phosphatidylglycerol:prolipoprotein diacylglycerol transferase